MGWNPDYATGASADSCWFLFAVDLQSQETFRKILMENFDFKVVQTWKGCVIAAAVIAFPLMYRNARAAFEQVDVNLIYAGQTLGMSDRRIFWKVIVPALRRELHLELFWHLQEQLVSMERLPCLQETFLVRLVQCPLQLQQKLRLEL